MGRRDKVARLIERSHVGAMLRRTGAWRGLLVLTYHRIGDSTGSPFDRNVWTTTAEGFDAQVAFLARNTDIVSPEDVPSLKAKPGRYALLTFDDGYRDNHDVALPILRRHGATATFFLSTGFLDDPRVPWWDEVAWMVRTSERGGVTTPESGAVRFDDPHRIGAVTTLIDTCKLMPGTEVEGWLERLGEATGTGRARPEVWPDQWMTWDHARAMLAAGMSIGGHTIDHPILARLDPEAQRAQIEGCRARLRDELGIPMRWFSYPNGDPGSYDATTRAALEDAGVELSFTFEGSRPSLEALDPYAVTRSTVTPMTSPALLAGMVTLPKLFLPPRPSAPQAPSRHASTA
jgi:peptidoglycan/xylan/chitin deacetylase (PgdA/CDA1 family)